MLQFAVLGYGLLLSYVMSSVSHNRRSGRSHPQILIYVGYVLCGMSAGAAVLLPIWAGFNPAGVAALANSFA